MQTAAQNPSVLIVAGGTGGHIIPGIALAQKLTEMRADSGSGIYILSSVRNQAFADFENTSLRLHFYDPPRITKNPLRLPAFLWKLFRAFLKARGLFRDLNIRGVVGMGGYTTLPALLAAMSLQIPFFLCEQNAIPGRATRLFAKKARRIYLGVPVAKDSAFRLPEEKCVLTGNPLKPALLDFHKKYTNDSPNPPPTPPLEKKANAISEHKKSARKNKKESPNKNFHILVLGGSQGALQLNQMCEELIRQQTIGGLRWSIQCGERHLADMKEALSGKLSEGLYLFGYDPDIFELLRDADLLICRAGAGVLSEGALFGLPMILVPYPYAQDNHQLANARYYESEGAAFVIASKEVETKRLGELILKIKGNKDLYKNMQEKSRRLARPDAASAIARDLSGALSESARA